MMEGYLYQYFFNLFMQLLEIQAFLTLGSPHKKRFTLRVCGVIAGGGLVGIGLVSVARLIPSELAWMSVFYYGGVFLLLLLGLLFCFQMEWKEALFFATTGYAVQHIFYAVYDIAITIYQVSVPNYVLPGWGVRFFNSFLQSLMVGGIAYLVLIRPMRGRIEFKQVDIRMIACSISILVASVVLSELIPAGDTPALAWAHVICRLYAMLACGTSIFMQCNISRINKMENDRRIQEQLLHMEKQQQQMTKDSIDVINMKFHDLKYRLQALEQMDSHTKRQESIHDLQKSVEIYDSAVMSGNDSLDLILTEKSLVCQKNQIKFSCMADGAKLNFMASPDIYSLFGNALDNAIECVRTVEPEKRIITMYVAAVGDMLNIHIDNYCETPVTFSDGLPVTTKEDARFHGFGTRSIRCIVQQYNGEMRMNWEEQQYNLDILFPL
jgi:hypothetical protein